MERRALEIELISWDGGPSTQRFRLQMQSLHHAFTHITHWPQRFSFSFPSCLGTALLSKLFEGKGERKPASK